MKDYSIIIKEVFGNIINKYKFEIIERNNEQIFLLGVDFAFSILTSMEDVDLKYIVYNRKTNLFVEHDFNYELRQKTTKEDRINHFGRIFKSSDEVYANYQTNTDRLIDSLKFKAAIMEKYFDDILSGSKNWLIKYEDKRKYPEKKLDERTTEFLKPYFKSLGVIN